MTISRFSRKSAILSYCTQQLFKLRPSDFSIANNQDHGIGRKVALWLGRGSLRRAWRRRSGRLLGGSDADGGGSEAG